jgi:acyl-CoA hydrolase
MEAKMNESKTSKTPSKSAVESRYLVMPDQANPSGTAFGGVIMGWIDMVASLAAQRHSETDVVTVGVDSINFRHPIYIGDQVLLKACINYVSRTSMEVGVQVIKENPMTGITARATTAHLTFVALDKNRKPTPVIPLAPETDDEKRRYDNAKLRVKTRKELIKKIRIADKDV